MHARIATLVSSAMLVVAHPGASQGTEDLVRSYLWPHSNAAFDRAESQLGTDPALIGVDAVPSLLFGDAVSEESVLMGDEHRET